MLKRKRDTKTGTQSFTCEHSNSENEHAVGTCQVKDIAKDKRTVWCLRGVTVYTFQSLRCTVIARVLGGRTFATRFAFPAVSPGVPGLEVMKRTEGMRSTSLGPECKDGPLPIGIRRIPLWEGRAD